MKLKSKHVTIGLAVVAIIVAGFLIFEYGKIKPITHYKVNGIELGFRDDLRAAQNISISGESAILETVWHPDIVNFTIVFVNSTDNHLVEVNSVEITYKLNLIFYSTGSYVEFKGKEVETYEGLKAENGSMIIAMIPPVLAKETGVSFNDGVVYIQGTTKRDFDLATIKFLMASLGITV